MRTAKSLDLDIKHPHSPLKMEDIRWPLSDVFESIHSKVVYLYFVPFSYPMGVFGEMRWITEWLWDGSESEKGFDL